MLVPTSEDVYWYLLLLFICIVLFTIVSRREMRKNCWWINCLCITIISGIASFAIFIFTFLLSSTYYEVNGDGIVKEYHILYWLNAPNGEKIWTYGSKMYCYNKSSEEYKIQNVNYYSFNSVFQAKIQKNVKPHEVFKVPDNIDILYFWKIPKTIIEKRSFTRNRSLFMRKDKIQ